MLKRELWASMKLRYMRYKSMKRRPTLEPRYLQGLRRGIQNINTNKFAISALPIKNKFKKYLD